MSDQGTWYLDHLDVPWDKFYLTEPHIGITDAAEQELVIGGEVCMWGETVDASDILQTIWPRAAAAAGKKHSQHLLYILFLRFQWVLLMTILWIS